MNMYCPNCGKANQQVNTYCRQCGKFLPDFDKIKRREISPEEHLKANSVLNIMTAIASITLAILLYVFFFGREDTPILIYITAGFLTAMFAWQVQVFWRNLKLKKQITRHNNSEKNLSENVKISENFQAAPTKELLAEADLNDVVPVSVIENTTKNLIERKARKSS